jgi:hypothetical protein
LRTECEHVGVTQQILDLIERMEARKEKGFRVSPQTAPLIVEALRLYARMAPQPNHAPDTRPPK